MSRKGEAYLGGGSIFYGSAKYLPERPNLAGRHRKEKEKPEIRIIKTALDRSSEAFQRELRKKQRELKKAGKFTGRIIPTINLPKVETPDYPARKPAKIIETDSVNGKNAPAIFARWNLRSKAYKAELNQLVREAAAHFKVHGDGRPLTRIIMAIPDVTRRRIALDLLRRQAKLVLGPKRSFRVERSATRRDIDPSRIDIFATT